MPTSPEPRPRGRLARFLMVALAAVAVAGLLLGAGDVVRAAFQDPPLVKPYDPLPHW